jgi:hypothetical protein
MPMGGNFMLLFCPWHSCRIATVNAGNESGRKCQLFSGVALCEAKNETQVAVSSLSASVLG